MYRTVKLFYGFVNVFVLYPLIIYVLSTTTLLLAAEGAEAPPPSSEIKEAEQIVGTFLRNEAGTSWLSDLAKSRSAPLTTQDLMNEIMASTRSGTKVWKAASILSESLKNETLKGTGMGPVMGQPENWKDLIEHIENEKDIICLYRKNNEQASEKEKDWQTFLKNVSPGYTVHLAIDTGNKYVICLKKIEVSETSPELIVSTEKIVTTEEIVAPEESMTTEENSTNAEISVDPKLIDSENIFPIKSDKQENLVRRKNLTMPNKSSDKRCKNDEESSEEFGKSGKKSPIIDLGDEDAVDKLNNDFNGEYDYRPTKYKNKWRSSKRPTINKKELNLENNGRPSFNSYQEIFDRLSGLPPNESECNRPIIVVMQNDNIPSQNGPWIPSGNYRVYPPKMPAWFLNRVPYGAIPQRSSSDLYYSRHNLKPQKSPLNSVMPMDMYKSLSASNNRKIRIDEQNQIKFTTNSGPIVSRYPNFLQNIAPRKIEKPVGQPFSKQIMKSAGKANILPVMRPIMKTTRSPFVSQPVDVKYQTVPPTVNIKNEKPQNSDLVKDLRSPFGDYMPRRTGNWQISRFPYSNLPKPSPYTKFYSPRRNFTPPPRNILEKVNPANKKIVPQFTPVKNFYGNRQPLESYKNSRSLQRPPIFESGLSILPKNVQPQNQQRYPHSRDIKFTGKSYPPTSMKCLGQELSFPGGNIDRRNCPLMNILGRYPSRQNIYRNSFSNLNPNYPMANNFIQPNVRNPIALQAPLNPPCFIPWSNNFQAFGQNNPVAGNFLAQAIPPCNNPLICRNCGNENERRSENCPSPCDRPVKLQIIINGKIQEPLEVSVMSEPGQKIEIIGSEKPTMRYGGRALEEGTPLLDDIGNVEETVDDRIEKKKKEQENSTTEMVPLVRNLPDKNEKLDEENSSTTEFTPETTSLEIKPETNEELEIKERFLNKTTTETISKDSTVEIMETMSTTINSTMIEYK